MAVYTHLNRIKNVKRRTPQGCEECLKIGAQGSICAFVSNAVVWDAVTRRRTSTRQSIFTQRSTR